MVAVVGVRFQTHGTLHLLRLTPEQRFEFGDQVLYPSEGGPVVGIVAWSGQATVSDDIPTCLGAASPADLTNQDAARARRAEIEAVAKALIEQHQLPMRVLAVDHQQPVSGQSLAVVYYSAPERIDFRGLLLDLGRVLQCRLDLRQVGERDAARLVSDVGSCGRPSCCTTCLQSLAPVTGIAGRSIQGTVGVGACGRPLCCLGFSGCQSRKATDGRA
ncbi:MAG: regulatory iron-sulfur-containing complex subunit RicT [Acidobacteriota bacterium]|nr:regulatory iron-sulfur-containing complex subunit RicT [Acidobacteriota bacterium]